MKYLITLLLCINVAFAQCPNGTFVDIIINPDQYPQETSWAIITELEDTIASGGPYTDIVDYEPQLTQVCIPNGEYIFNIADHTEMVLLVAYGVVKMDHTMLCIVEIL